MVKISVSLTEKQYSHIIYHYLINRPGFRVVTALITTIILGSVITVIFIPHRMSLETVLLWISLFVVYLGVMSFLISTRTKTIYQNTTFLQQEMTFEFSSNLIKWQTISGVLEKPITDMTKIVNISEALILSFSPYQLMPIPYKDIQPEQWEEIKNLIAQNYTKPLKDKLYQKYHENKDIK